MGILRIMHLLNTYRSQLITNREAFIEKVGENPNMSDPRELRTYEVAAADRRMGNTFALSDLKNKVMPEITAMRTRNHARRLEAPTADMLHILQVLQMVDAPSEELMTYAARSLNGNVLALYALNSIARKAKKAQVDIYLPMSEEDAAAALDALETHLKSIMEQDADDYLASAEIIDTNKVEDFVASVLHVPARPFLEAVEE